MARSKVLSGLEGTEDFEVQEETKQEETEQAEEEKDEEVQQEEEEPPEWKKSKARDYLFKLCLNPDFPAGDAITPKQVWEEEPWKVKDVPEFKWFQDYNKFAGRLRDQRKRAYKKTGRAKEDDEYLKHDRKIFPERTQDFGGEPIWQRSKAQELLRRDLNDEERMQLKPKQLQLLEEEYLKFSLENFRDRIYQERKAMQRIVYVKKQRAAKEAKEKKKK